MDINKLINQSILEVFTETENKKSQKGSDYSAEDSGQETFEESWLSDLSDKAKETLEKGMKLVRREPTWFDKAKETLEKGMKLVRREPTLSEKAQKILEKGVRLVKREPTLSEKAQKILKKGVRLVKREPTLSEKAIKFITREPKKLALATGAAVAAGLGARTLAKELRKAKRKIR